MGGRWRGAIRALLLSQCQEDLLHGQVKRRTERQQHTENTRHFTHTPLYIKWSTHLWSRRINVTHDTLQLFVNVVSNDVCVCVCFLVSVWVRGGTYPPSRSDGLVRSSMTSPSTWTAGRLWAFLATQVCSNSVQRAKQNNKNKLIK